jgi:hypothetical protein
MASDVDHFVRPAVEGVRAIDVADGSVPLQVSAILSEVRSPAPNIAAPSRRAKAARVPHSKSHVWVRPQNRDLALLAVHGLTPAPGRRVVHQNIGVYPWQRPRAGIRAQWLICIAVAAAPHDPAVLGRPVRVDVLRRQMPHRECLNYRIDLSQRAKVDGVGTGCSKQK